MVIYPRCLLLLSLCCCIRCVCAESLTSVSLKCVNKALAFQSTQFLFVKSKPKIMNQIDTIIAADDGRRAKRMRIVAQ